MRPEILQQMLQTVLNIIMFEDCRNQWSMSRPLLGLILLNEDYFKVRRIQGYCVAPGPLVWTGLGLGLGLGGLGTKGLGPGLDKSASSCMIWVRTLIDTSSLLLISC